VIEASSGEEGLVRARGDQPDFILLDMMMPGMDGADTFRALRADAQTSRIPIVFLTAKAMTAKGVILKPFNPMTLADDIRTILGS
jgi:CheY-like chemotaxis protein